MSEKSIIVLHLLFYIYIYTVYPYILLPMYDTANFLCWYRKRKKEKKLFFLAHTQHFHKHLYTIEEIILKN